MMRIIILDLVLIINDASLSAWTSRHTESKLPQANQCGKMWLRLRNDANVLSAWYSADGKKWHKYPWGFEISGIIIRYMVSCLSAPGIFCRW